MFGKFAILSKSAIQAYLSKSAMNTAITKSPIGQLSLVEEDGVITALNWGGENNGFRTDVLKEGLRQLEAYFAGELQYFDLPLSVDGSLFHQLVSRQMRNIPFGETRTYGDLAKALEASPQAVGQACGANTIPIIIPCHRILGADSLGGFSGAGGVETKVWLLKHEGAAGLLI